MQEASPARGRPARGPAWSAAARRALLLGLLAAPAAGGCGGEPEAAAPPTAGAGTYVVLADSSRIAFLFQREGKPVVGTFPRVLGSFTFRERSTRSPLLATGSLSVDLGSVTLDDSTQARALADELFQAGTRPDFRTAELKVRELSGKGFTADLPPGGVTPIAVRGQLQVQRMAISREFWGEISRTPSGYRITNAVPIPFSIRELGLEDGLARWRRATGVGDVSDGVALSVDLRLARRGPPP